MYLQRHLPDSSVFEVESNSSVQKDSLTSNYAMSSQNIFELVSHDKNMDVSPTMFETGKSVLGVHNGNAGNH